MTLWRRLPRFIFWLVVVTVALEHPGSVIAGVLIGGWAAGGEWYLEIKEIP